MKRIFFKTKVNCKTPYLNEYEYYYDDGILLLPNSYSSDGAPTRLVIMCHGAGGTVTTDDAQIIGSTLAKYLLANGYAIMDVNGLPNDYAEKFDINIKNNIGSPIATESYIKAYNYCIENYNFYKEVLVHGASMGGISSTNLVLSGKIPVLAQSGFCPVLDTFNQIFLHPWSNGLPKFALGKLYSLDKDEKGEYVYNEEAILGCNPINSNKKHPCPLLFVHSIDDPIVNPEFTKKYIEKASGDGVETKLIILPAGAHEPQLYGDYLEKTYGNSYYEGEKLNITTAVEEAFIWLRTHEK